MYLLQALIFCAVVGSNIKWHRDRGGPWRESKKRPPKSLERPQGSDDDAPQEGACPLIQINCPKVFSSRCVCVPPFKQFLPRHDEHSSPHALQTMEPTMRTTFLALTTSLCLFGPPAAAFAQVNYELLPGGYW